MLGDTAVAGHPDDERYRDLVGRHAVLPLVGRRIPIVADGYAAPEQGSGPVKITPAPDFNAFEAAKRHDLELITIFDRAAHLTDTVPTAYRGPAHFQARHRLVCVRAPLALAEKTHDHTHRE